MPNLNIAALLQANPLLGLGVGGLNLGINRLVGAGGNTGGGQQDLLAMLSANAANVGQPNALYSNLLFLTLFPNHPNIGDSNFAPPAADPPQKPSSGSGSGGDIWPSLARTEPTPSAPVSNNGDTSWLSFLGGSRASQPPADEVDLSSLFRSRYQAEETTKTMIEAGSE